MVLKEWNGLERSHLINGLERIHLTNDLDEAKSKTLFSLKCVHFHENACISKDLTCQGNFLVHFANNTPRVEMLKPDFNSNDNKSFQTPYPEVKCKVWIIFICCWTNWHSITSTVTTYCHRKGDLCLHIELHWPCHGYHVVTIIKGTSQL